MKVLLDECLPKRLAKLLSGHEVRTTRQMNWQGLSNGNLLAEADPHFDVFVTVDKNLVRQQQMSGFRIAVIVLRAPSNKIEDLSALVPELLRALNVARPGTASLVPPEHGMSP